MIETHHREAIKREILDELEKGVLDRVECVEVIEMFRVDIGDDGDIGWKLQDCLLYTSRCV